MRSFGAPALAAIAAGQAMSVGAVAILTSTPLRIWGGYGDLVIGGNTFLGVGDRGLVSVIATALGGSEQNITLELSGVDPANLALFDLPSLRRAPVICYRLIFDASGRSHLASPVFARGRLDQVPVTETAGGAATISALVETAARGLGRGGGRVRSDADQRLIDPDDDGLKSVSFAGQTTVYWGGKIPQTVAQAFSAGPSPADITQQALDGFFGRG